MAMPNYTLSRDEAIKKARLFVKNRACLKNRRYSSFHKKIYGSVP